MHYLIEKSLFRELFNKKNSFISFQIRNKYLLTFIIILVLIFRSCGNDYRKEHTKKHIKFFYFNKIKRGEEFRMRSNIATQYLQNNV